MQRKRLKAFGAERFSCAKIYAIFRVMNERQYTIALPGTATARRLKALREEMNLTPTQIAHRLGIASARWGHWERGTNGPNERAAVHLAKTFGISLDYIYTGSTAGLSESLAAGLKAREERMEAEAGTLRHDTPPAPPARRAPPYEAIGQRLRAIRRVLGVGQPTIAEHASADLIEWQEWEAGKRRPDENAMHELRRSLPVTLAYVYEGSTDGIAPDLLARLAAAAQAAPNATTPKPEKRERATNQQPPRVQTIPDSDRLVGLRIQAIRQEMALGTAQAAELAGVSSNTWRRWERNGMTPRMDAIEALCRHVPVTPNYVFQGRLDGLPAGLGIRLMARTMGIDPETAGRIDYSGIRPRLVIRRKALQSAT